MLLYKIKVIGDLTPSLEIGLFPILERLLPIKFIYFNQGEIDVAGEIIIKDWLKEEIIVRSNSVPSLTMSLLTNEVENQCIQVEINFLNNPSVPFPFRGRRVNTKLSADYSVLSLHDNETVLATINEKPIWLVSEIGQVKYFRSAFSLPQILPNQNFSDLFNGECFLEMLILLEFIREVTASTMYHCAPLRAGFIIDDPNLHWPRYGFVDYREIAAHARRENYHVSFATIPLDTWFTNMAPVDLFKKNSQWLSLSIHGNNHAKEELAGNYSETLRKALLLQANWRIQCLEQKTKISVCRVMIPPHGACSEEILAELPKCGFEAACISAGSLRAYNKDKPWIKTLGFSPSETIKDSTVLPRWGLTGSIHNALLIAAYLGQPMILRGHHQDLKHGVELFDEFAKFINGLGNVFWSNMTNLSRLNYLSRMDGAVCYVKPLGTKIFFKPPSEATSIIIEKMGAINDSTWQVVSMEGSVQKILPSEPLFLSDYMHRQMLIESAVSKITNVATTGFKPTSIRLIARRLLTEARDRFLTF